MPRRIHDLPPAWRDHLARLRVAAHDRPLLVHMQQVGTIGRELLDEAERILQQDEIEAAVIARQPELRRRIDEAVGGLREAVREYDALMARLALQDGDPIAIAEEILGLGDKR